MIGKKRNLEQKYYTGSSEGIQKIVQGHIVLKTTVRHYNFKNQLEGFELDPNVHHQLIFLELKIGRRIQKVWLIVMRNVYCQSHRKRQMSQIGRVKSYNSKRPVFMTVLQYQQMSMKILQRRQWHPSPVLLPGKIPWTEESGRLQSIGWLRVGHDWTRLSDFLFTFHFHTLEKEMATHSSVLALRIPGTGEPGGLPSMGSHRVRHD